MDTTNTKTIEIYDEQIRKLSAEAAAAGDMSQFALCLRALGGDDAARGACAEAIQSAIDAR